MLYSGHLDLNHDYLMIANAVFVSVTSPDREAVRRYEELSEIFSDKDNYSQSRVLLKGVSSQPVQEQNTKHKTKSRETVMNPDRYTITMSFMSQSHVGLLVNYLILLSLQPGL